jgi:hypothetical protein
VPERLQTGGRVAIANHIDPKARTPVAVLLLPLVFSKSEFVPIAVLPLPV